MPSRSQRHLREVHGVDSRGSAGGGSLGITSPEAGASGTSVDFAAAASSEDGADISHLVQWSSDVDGALGTGAFTADLTVGEHTITAAVGGLTDTVVVTVS